MNNLELAEGLLQEAKIRIEYVELDLKQNKDYAFCVRLSQESVELSIKSMLRVLSIEYSKTYDPGRILEANRDKLPDWLSEELNSVTYVSRWLRAEREPSMYGDEVEGIPPSELYNEDYCVKAMEAARKVLKLAERLIYEVKRK
ncbi:DNA-binding protein [Sulfolobales archaeon HS-7]|nr:DNA-binding protein [Sulfolobales archaeon HS-7]